jgi:RNase adaptor protein for sRNA GlmZ degradation
MNGESFGKLRSVVNEIHQKTQVFNYFPDSSTSQILRKASKTRKFPPLTKDKSSPFTTIINKKRKLRKLNQGKFSAKFERQIESLTLCNSLLFPLLKNAVQDSENEMTKHKFSFLDIETFSNKYLNSTFSFTATRFSH